MDPRMICSVVEGSLHESLEAYLGSLPEDQTLEGIDLREFAEQFSHAIAVAVANAFLEAESLRR